MFSIEVDLREKDTKTNDLIHIIHHENDVSMNFFKCFEHPHQIHCFNLQLKLKSLLYYNFNCCGIELTTPKSRTNER